MTDPRHFRRDREWPCPEPTCHAELHSVVMLQLHYATQHALSSDGIVTSINALDPRSAREVVIESQIPLPDSATWGKMVEGEKNGQ